MCHWNFVLWFLLLTFHPGGNAQQLPSWITNNPVFKTPTEIDSIKKGNGSLESKEKTDLGWLIHLNDKLGYGVEIHLEKLEVNPEDYLLIAGWPMATQKFQQIKLLTGNFKETQKIIISNTKSFFVLYSAAGSSTSPQLLLKYKRYGVSYEKNPPATESPIKKETVYEIQLKGKAPDDYSEVEFLNKLKEAIRATAKTFCLSHNIPFNDNIPTNEMVVVHKVFYCPFEWPERDVCASLQHSVFVSGKKIPDGLIINYELTAQHLKTMWAESEHTELEELGISVRILKIFRLPGTSSTVLWWSVVVGVVMACSLVGVLVFWSVEKLTRDIRFRPNSGVFEKVKHRVRPKMKLTPHQQIPPFMYESSMDTHKFEKTALTTVKADTFLKSSLEDAKPGKPQQFPNYVGALFFSNRSFEDDEGNVVELRPK